MYVDHDRDAVGGRAGRGQRRSGHAEPRRRGQQDRGDEAYDGSRHPQPHAFADRNVSAGAACVVDLRHWSREVVVMPSCFAVVIAALS